MDTAPLAFRAPAPVPHRRPLSTVAFVLTAYRNPLEIWGERAYTQPYVVANWLGNPTIIVSDPAAIRYLLVENAKNYAMQPLRQRVLRPILRDGLLTAEGELWRRTRRSIAPIFAPRNTAPLAETMVERAQGFAAGLGARDGQTIDVATQMTLLAFDILQATLFTGDIAGDPDEFAAATARLLKTMGRVDPMDVLDAPAFVHVTANVTDVQIFARRHQGFEEELAILSARVAVAALGLFEHAIQTRIGAIAWELALVHADEADDAERNGALRHESAERHAAEQEGLAFGYRIELAAHGFARDAPRQFLRAGRRGLGAQFRKRAPQRIQRATFCGIVHVRAKQHVDPLAKPGRPIAQAARLRKSVAQLAQAIQQAMRTPECERGGRVDARQRQHIVE